MIFKGEFFMNRKEKLTEATMLVLQREKNKKDNIDKKDETYIVKKLSKLIDIYVVNYNLEEFVGMLLELLTDVQVYKLVKKIETEL